MKTAKEWLDENSQQSGAFDLVHSSADAIELIEKIQDDAQNTESVDLVIKCVNCSTCIQDEELYVCKSCDAEQCIDCVNTCECLEWQNGRVKED